MNNARNTYDRFLAAKIAIMKQQSEKNTETQQQDTDWIRRFAKSVAEECAQESINTIARRAREIQSSISVKDKQ